LAILGLRSDPGPTCANRRRRARQRRRCRRPGGERSMAQTMTATHPITTPRPRLASLLDMLDRVPLSLHLMLFRLAVASVFFKAGMTKWASWESTIALFAEEYKVPVLPPAMAAALATTFELGCSTLLALGLATRLATLPILGQLMVIQLFVYPQ